MGKFKFMKNKFKFIKMPEKYQKAIVYKQNRFFKQFLKWGKF